MERIAYFPLIPASVIESLSSDTITKKEYDRVLEIINKRFSYVFIEAMHIMGRSIDWFDFDNEASNSDGTGAPGYFDPKTYKNEIDVVGDFQRSNALYDESIPTAWLSEDFEEALRQEVAAHKVAQEAKSLKAKEENLAAKKERDAIVMSIKAKLTKQELKYISFKS